MTTDEHRQLVNLRPVGRCQGPGCVALLLTQPVWSRFDARDRRDLSVVFASHKARRLCTRCYKRAKAAGELPDHDTVHQTSAERAAEYEWMRDRLPVGGSRRERLRAAGQIMDCSPDAVRLALKRRGITP